MDESNVNKKCMERILQRLTGLICMLEYNDIESIERFVNMSTSISAQLIAIDKMDSNIDYDEDEGYEEE